MSVSLLKEEFIAQNGSWTKDGYQYVRSFIVQTTDEDERLYSVLNCSGLPTPSGSTYPEDEGAVCTDLNGVCFQKHNATDETGVIPSGGLWRVTANYSSYYEDVQQSKSPLYPNRAAQYHYHWQTGTMPVDYYFVSGEKRLLRNLVGQPFLPAIEKLIAMPRLDIQVNLAEGSLPNAGDYFLKTNSDTYFGFSAGQARVINIDAQGPNTEHNIEFYAVSISIEFDPRGFDPIVLQAGLSQKVSGKITAIRDDDDKPITEPIPLKTSGSDVIPVAPADMGAAPGSGGPTFTQFSGFYEQTSFAGLVF